MRLFAIAVMLALSFSFKANAATIWPQHLIDSTMMANLLTLQQAQVSDAQTFPQAVTPPGTNASLCSMLIQIGFLQTSSQIILFTQLARDTHYLLAVGDDMTNNDVFLENVTGFNSIKGSIDGIFAVAANQCGENPAALAAIAKGRSNLATLDGLLGQLAARAH